MASKENQEALDFIKKAEPYLPNALVRLLFLGKTIAMQQALDDLELYKKAFEQTTEEDENMFTNIVYSDEENERRKNAVKKYVEEKRKRYLDQARKELESEKQ